MTPKDASDLEMRHQHLNNLQELRMDLTFSSELGVHSFESVEHMKIELLAYYYYYRLLFNLLFCTYWYNSIYIFNSFKTNLFTRNMKR